jgi:hypothetical protein
MLFNKYLHCQEVSGKHIQVSMGYGILIPNSLHRLQYSTSLMALYLPRLQPESRSRVQWYCAVTYSYCT